MVQTATLNVSFTTNNHPVELHNRRKIMNIQTEALNRFVEFDKDGNGYLSRAELQRAQTASEDATSRLVAEALTVGYDWIKKLSDDQTFLETEISFEDLRRIEVYRQDAQEIKDVMDEFPKLDLNGDGYVSGQELNRLSRTQNHGIKNLDFYLDTSRQTIRGTATQYQDSRVAYLASLSNDQWGLESINTFMRYSTVMNWSVSMADLKVVQEAGQQIDRMEKILNSRKP